ncbi:hypothetical protein ACRAWG_27770 [Methylobacterium sp. P31]
MRIRSHALRAAATALVCGTLGACNTVRGPSARSSASGPIFTALAPSTQRTPLLSLPAAGAPVLVDEVRYPDGVRQTIRFGSSGTSRADLTLGAGGSGGALKMEKPTRTGIAAELANLGDGPYRVLTQPAHNAYGPIGVARGHRCAFAWQWIDRVGGELGVAWPANGPISASLRVHHCGRGATASTDALIADLTRLRLGPVAPGQITHRPRPRVAKVAAAPTQTPAQTPDLTPIPAPAPVVASRPLVAVNGSRTLVDLPQDILASPTPVQRALSARPAAPVVAVPRPDAAGTDTASQARYLTDPGQARPSVAIDTPPARRSREDELSTALPPQAYRGPTPPPFGW